jgi:hypothetical protein
VEEISAKHRRGLRCVFVDTVDEVFAAALKTERRRPGVRLSLGAPA